MTAQDLAIHGVVVSKESGAAVAGAIVTAAVSHRTTATDQFGQFTLRLSTFPETLTVRAAGLHLSTRVLTAAPDQPVAIAMDLGPVQLAEITVTAPPGATSPEITELNRWQLSQAATRSIPVAVEPDILRTLILVPGVNFTTPLSARPLFRGYDTGESVFRIDGFEVVNPYHVGRFLTGLSADAADRVAVTAAPFAADRGGALAGDVDVYGRGGWTGGMRGGFNLSLASASGWAGGGSERVREFTAARAAYLGAVTFATGNGIPYTFEDLYTSTDVYDGAGEQRGRVTLFGSHDRLWNDETAEGMTWGNILVGSRWAALRSAAASIELTGFVSQSAEEVRHGPARSTRIDVDNAFTRAGGSALLEVRGVNWQVAVGAEPGWRSVSNHVTPRQPTAFFRTYDVEDRRLEGAGFAELRANFGRLSSEVGIRLDATGGNSIWQPRGRIRLPLGERFAIGAAAGRVGRLYHLVSDPISEPGFLFYDFWLPAGVSGIPVPMVDHASMELQFTSGRTSVRLGAFGSSGTGIVELRPPEDTATVPDPQFRYGDSRTAGIEAQWSLKGADDHAPAFVLTYSYNMSERRWGSAWIPWGRDRRHSVRAVGQATSGSLVLYGAGEFQTAPPLTPVEGLVLVGSVDPTKGIARDTTNPGDDGYLMGAENSQRGGATFHADFGASQRFTGPWNSTCYFGVAIINLALGSVAQERSILPGSDIHGVARVRYERSFILPPVPTFTLRMEF